MGFFSRHRKAFKSVIASFGMLFGLLAGVSVTANVGYARIDGSLNTNTISSLITITEKRGEKDGSWHLSDDGIWGTVTGFSALIDYEKTGTIEITAKEKVGISFDWEASVASKGSVSVAGSTQSTGHYENTALGSGKKISVTIKATGSANTTTIDIANLRVVKIATPSILFDQSTVGGLFKVDGEQFDGTLQKNSSSSWVGYQLEAIPTTGYDFFGWQISNLDGSSPRVVSCKKVYKLMTSDDCRVTAIFKEGQNLAVFSNDSLYFDDLNKAIQHAKKVKDYTIVVARSGTISAGNYVLDGSTKLLIPHNSGNLFLTSDPEFVEQTRLTGSETNEEYRKLELKSGTTLNVREGSSISVGSKMYCVSAQYSSYPIGGYGRLELESGAKVILNSGSNFYCWGFATGDGEIEAKSGANVYEMFQMGGYRGGGATRAMKDDASKYHVFPFNQYYVQNIEAKLIVNYGATETVAVGIYTNGLKGIAARIYHSSFCFIGKDNNGMFSLTRGYLTKKYLPSQDRLEVEIHGDGGIRSISFKLGVDFDSSEYVLPITNNIGIELAEGDFTVNIEQDIALLPGSTIKVGHGSKFVIKNNHSIYLYGKDDWKTGYAFNGLSMAPVYFSPTTGSKPNIRKNVVDALFDVNGTVEVQSGCGLYSCVTGNPAPFISSKRTGNVLFASEQAAEIVDQYTHQAEKNEGSGLDVKITYGNIPINRIQFRNGDLSITSDALPANSTVVYDKVLDRWSVSTAHAKKFGLFKTLDGSTVQTVLLHDDIKQSNYTGLFYYSKKTSASYNAADERYYYLNKGVVSKRNEWWKDATKGAYYHFGPNQYAYQSVSVVLSPTASGDNPARGIKARYFFDTDAKLLRMVSVDSITSNFSSGMTITSGICYYNGIKAGFGLFENQSHVYLAKDDGTLMANGTYYVPSHKINNIKDSSGKVLTAGLYYFDENGHMYDSNFKVITRGTAS